MAEQTQQRNRILIVEDEGIVATDIEKSLEGYGYEVIGIAASADEAVEQASKSCPDLVLMDIRIQGKLDGIEAADLLRRRLGVPIMYLSAHGDKETMERAKTTEPIGFLLKPFKEVELANAIEIALQRVKAERELREREQWLVAAIGSIGDAVLSTDEHGNVRFMNRAAETLTGWTRHEGLGLPITEIVKVLDERGESGLGGFLAAAESTEHVSPCEPGLAASEAREPRSRNTADETRYCIMTRGGSLSWVTARGASVTGPDGRIIRIAVLQDITRRKEAEEALQRQADLLDQSHDAILTWQLSGEITYWNHGAEILYGYTRHEAVGRVVHELLRTAHPLGVTQMRAALQRDGQWSGELTHTTKEGRVILVESLIVMVKEPGEGSTVLATNRDITDRKRVEKELSQLNEQLEQRVRERTRQLEAANREMESFSYSVSHDLRAPLRGIDGWSLALLEDYASQLDERARRYLDRIRSEAQRMGLLIDDLLHLSRVTRAEMSQEPVDLTLLVKRIAAKLNEAEPARQIEFVINRDLKAIGDARLLEVALTNLLANSVKFTAPRAQARIEIGQTERNGDSAFYVRDNGVGFDMDHAGMLFGAFQRLHKANEFPGTGIGLATVQRVIQRHGGRVWAESQVDQGATFYFSIAVTNELQQRHPLNRRQPQ